MALTEADEQIEATFFPVTQPNTRVSSTLHKSHGLAVSAEPKLHLFGRYENDSISANTRFSFSSERPSQRRLIRPEVTCFREVRLVDTLAGAAESGAHLRMAPMPFPQHFQTGKIHAYSDRRSQTCACRAPSATILDIVRSSHPFVATSAAPHESCAGVDVYFRKAHASA